VAALDFPFLSCVISADGVTATIRWQLVSHSDSIWGTFTSSLPGAGVTVPARSPIQITVESVDSIVVDVTDTGWTETVTLSTPVFVGETCLWSSPAGHTQDDTVSPHTHRSKSIGGGVVTNNSAVEMPIKVESMIRHRNRLHSTDRRRSMMVR